MIPTCLLLFLLLSVLKVATLARARTINFTVDDQDPEIDYFPRSSWQTVDALDVDFGGSHMFTSDVDGYAEIKKTFISFYIISALYPTRIMANIALDGVPIGRINLQDYNPHFNLNVTDNITAIHGTVPCKIVFPYPGNSSQEHVIRLSSVGDSPLVLDAFIFEVDPAPSITSASVNMSTSLHTAAIVGGVIGILALGVLVAMMGLFLRRRKAKQVEHISQYLSAPAYERNHQNVSDANDQIIPRKHQHLQRQAHQQPSETFPALQLSNLRAYHSAVVKRRVSNPAVQATVPRLPTSSDPRSNIDNPGTEVTTDSEPPPYDTLSFAQ